MARAEAQLDPPGSSEASSLADWAEAILLVESRRRLSRSAMRRRLSGEHTRGDEEIQITIDLLLEEVDRRERLAPDAYPFATDEIGMIRRRDVDPALYEFVLLLSVSPAFRQQREEFDEPVELFELLVAEALRGLLGRQACTSIRFGHPSKEGRPANFPEAIVWLADRLNLNTGAGTPRPQRRDGGADVVAWRPFLDGRSAYVVVLCQCTVAKDWVPKAKDIVAGHWRGWIDFGLDPLTALAIPFSVRVGFDRWDEVRRTVNLILDRFRLLECLTPAAFDDFEGMREWIDREMSLLSVGPA
jgi:hypothetical protein